MEITEVRIKLMDGGEDRLRGFCSITFDRCFVIRDLKIIDGNTGLFIAMPSRKLTSHCPRCRMKNHLRSRYCNGCGWKLPTSRVESGPDGRGKLYADVAHPINAECREHIQRRIVEEYHAEVERAKLPGYRSRYDDDYESGHNGLSSGGTPGQGLSPELPAAGDSIAGRVAENARQSLTSSRGEEGDSRGDSMAAPPNSVRVDAAEVDLAVERGPHVDRSGQKGMAGDSSGLDRSAGNPE